MAWHFVSVAGDVFKCFFAVTFIGMGAGMAAGAFPNLSKATISVRSIFAVLDRESKIDPESDDGDRPDKARLQCVNRHALSV